MKKLTLLSFVFSLFLLMTPEKNMAAENLQAIIDSTKEGAVLRLENKTYEGNITINKSLTIIGLNKTVIKGDGTGNVIQIKAANVKLNKLTVTGSSMDRNSAEEYAAIKVYTNDNVIEHIKIRHSFHGIYLSKAHHNTIRYNTIIGLGKGEIAAQGNGLQVFYAHDNLLSHNTIEGTRDGMFFDYANNNKSYENNISNTRYGLHYMYSDDNIFKKNTFTMNNGGAAIMNSNHLRLEDNQFIVNDGNQSFGLLLLQANDNAIENNTFYMNQRGLYIDQSTRNTIRNNRITQNKIGIELWASSSEQTFTLNQISDNTIPVVTLGGKGENNSFSKDGKGNDWGSAFPLPDLNQDGIGDFPVIYYSSLHQLIEDQELTSLFLKSPAIPIYEKLNASKQGDGVMFQDSHPLAASKEHHSIAIFIALGIGALLILIKRRPQLCITFGRNGRKI
ncbi:MAG TPA: nitrous oxide reductase family maturation protein NosD [Neobacillus sp.]